MVTDNRRVDDELPDPALFWRWVWRAVRPWLGWLLVALGAVLVLLGYLGVSRESIVAKQIPYIMSGGLLGIVIAIVGAYFLGTQELRRDSGRLDRLEAMVTELHEAILGSASATNDDTGDAVDAKALFAISGAETYHRAGCPMLDAKDAESITPAATRRRKLRPCPLCEPALVDA
jgi:hypothetical protein